MTKQELETLLKYSNASQNPAIKIAVGYKDGTIEYCDVVGFEQYSDCILLSTDTLTYNNIAVSFETYDINKIKTPQGKFTESETKDAEIDESKCSNISEDCDGDGFDTDGTDEDDDNEEYECESSKQLRALLKGHKWWYDDCCDTNNHNHYLKKGDCVVYISTKHSAMPTDDDRYYIATMIVDNFDFDSDCAARGSVGKDWYGWNTHYAPGLTYYRIATERERADFLKSVPEKYRYLIKK